MKIIEIADIFAMLILGILASISDLRKGIIYNKMLLIFSVFAVISDIVYYGFFNRDLFLLFLFNISVMFSISLFLFFSHSFAGGDTKLAIVFSLLFPARLYLTYQSSEITLFFTLGIAIILGYIYLFCSAVYSLIKKESHISFKYIKDNIFAFLKSFIIVMLYVFAVNTALSLISTNIIELNIWIIRIVCIAVALIIGKYKIFKKVYSVVLITILDLAICLIFKTIPFSLNFENYIFISVLLICRLTIRTDLYKYISVNELKSGMILSTASSAIMQNSRVKGLPKISSEDLRSRLTESEVESILRWSKNTNVDTVSIVKKIPFAIFIFMGFSGYIIIWSSSL